MITTTLTWYSIEEKLPSETDNIMFITKQSNGTSAIHLLKGYYNEQLKAFIEEDKHLNDVSKWRHNNVAYWAVVDYFTVYSKLDKKVLSI